RDVALKFLPDAFASDPDRLARFQREAQTLAALNHPNIAHIHGLETGRLRAEGAPASLAEARDGTGRAEAGQVGQAGRAGQAGQAGQAGTDAPFLVMELVEGEDLAERLVRGPIPLDEALPIARQIAEALE